MELHIRQLRLADILFKLRIYDSVIELVICNKEWEFFLKYDVRGSLNKFPDFFHMGTFIDSTHKKL